MAASFANGGRLFAIGNGGSCTDAADLASLFLYPGPGRRALPAFALASRKASAKPPKSPMSGFFIASHPGSDLNAMIDLALFLKRNGYRPDQVQDFIPAPFDIATALYWTGIDPFTGEEVYVAKGLRDRKMQRALMQFFKPENYFMVREALLKAGRGDLIGSGCDCLIPSNPPKVAIEARRKRANEIAEGDHYHSMGSPSKGEPVGEGGLPNQGYRPGRKTARRQDKKRRR